MKKLGLLWIVCALFVLPLAIAQEKKTDKQAVKKAPAVAAAKKASGESLSAAELAKMKPDAAGLAIARAADKHDTGFKNFVAAVEMILKNRQGQTSTRFMRSRTLEVESDGDKSMIIFDNPRDVKGTAVLTYSHKVDADDQWLYLPALKRVKRIASNNKSGPFVGSEFAYEDLASQEVEKYTYKYLRDEPCEKATKEKGTCHVVERDPVDKYSGYSRQIVWMDTEEFRVYRVEFYDRKNSLLKTLTMSGYREYAGQYWRADEFFMENHQTGKTTKLNWKNYKFGQKLTARDFDKNSLKRAK